MPPALPLSARRATVVSARPSANNVILYDGSALNIDYNAYISQHDLVYHAPPTTGSEGMPIGDGDIGAMLWCPGSLQLQIQKSDLWSDPGQATDNPSDWRQVSAGTVAIRSDPSFLTSPSRFEQRLSLSSGVVTISSDTCQGACQITAFASATAGVIVINYKDQTVRKAERRVDVNVWREAHLFALGETIGILQGLPDRRYALLARASGAPVTAHRESATLSSLHLGASRSTEFTLYISVAVSPRDGDPVAAARSRLEAAMSKGFDRLALEQRQHWNMYWQKSFLRLAAVGDDPLPHYLENLWYLSLYQLACCSRGYEAPLPNGGLWLSREDMREGPALYDGHSLRQMLAALVASNHLELSVPYVDTLYRLLPDMAARTGSELGLGGARIPGRFSHTGKEVAFDTPSVIHVDSADRSRTNSTPELEDGLDTALLVWDAWRHNPDTYFLLERAYPLLRSCTSFAIEYFQAYPERSKDLQVRAKLKSALRALMWASREYGLDDELRPEWESAWQHYSRGALPYTPAEFNPFGDLNSTQMAVALGSIVRAIPQQPAGLFGTALHSPDMVLSAGLTAGLNSMLLKFQPLPAVQTAGSAGQQRNLEGFGGAQREAIRVFPALPAGWSAAFSLSAPGGFRISAEATEGKARYVAVKSLLGGICRLINPWGMGERARILEGRESIVESAAPILEFMTQANRSYLVERGSLPLSRAISVRLGGKRNEAPKHCFGATLGIDSPAGLLARERTENPDPLSQRSQDAVVFRRR